MSLFQLDLTRLLNKVLEAYRNLSGTRHLRLASTSDIQSKMVVKQVEIIHQATVPYTYV